MDRKRYSTFYLASKIKLIKDVDSKTIVITDIGWKFGLHKSTVSKIARKSKTN